MLYSYIAGFLHWSFYVVVSYLASALCFVWDYVFGPTQAETQTSASSLSVLGTSG
jgi:hypothetical protein